MSSLAMKSDLSSNENYHRALASELQDRLDKVHEGGGAKAVERHHARAKLLPRGPQLFPKPYFLRQ